MQMTDWFTAGLSKKPKPSRLVFKRAWRSAIWNCILSKPGLSTVKTKTQCGVSECHVRLPRLLLSATLGQEYSEPSIILWIPPSGQPRCVEEHTVDDQELENSPTNATYDGGNRSPSQSSSAGVDGVLRELHALGVGAYLPARQLDAAALGATEI